VVAAIAEDGSEAVAIPGEVGKAADIVSMFMAVDRQFGRLDGLVNNAGIVDYPQRVDEMSVVRIERMRRGNVTGSILCSAEA
ncbi:SDR family NAD(P)-dependent oxidoreductase, partial [Rhizobium ruizarguesonis]